MRMREPRAGTARIHGAGSCVMRHALGGCHDRHHVHAPVCTWCMARGHQAPVTCMHHAVMSKVFEYFFHKTIHMVPKHHNIHLPTINHHYNGNGAWRAGTKPRACTTRRPVIQIFLIVLFFHKTTHMVSKHYNIHFTTINCHYNGAWHAGTKPRGCTTCMHHAAPGYAQFFGIFFFFIKPPTWSQNIIIYTSQPSIAITMVFQPNFVFILYFFNILIYKKNLHKKFSKNCVLNS